MKLFLLRGLDAASRIVSVVIGGDCVPPSTAASAVVVAVVCATASSSSSASGMKIIISRIIAVSITVSAMIGATVPPSHHIAGHPSSGWRGLVGVLVVRLPRPD